MKRGATFKNFQTFFSEAEQYLEQKNYGENFLWGGTGISPVLPRLFHPICTKMDEQKQNGHTKKRRRPEF